MATVQQVLTIASKEIGYAEKPVNNTKYAKFFGTNGIQWCGVFVNWVFAQANYKLHNTWYTPSGAEGFKARKAFFTRGKIQPGDVLYFDFPNDNVDRISHTGIAVKDLGAKGVLCIEGNTTGPAIVKGKKKDERNGGAVALKLRPKSFIVGWGRPVYKDAEHPIVHTLVEQFFPKPVKKVAKKVAKKATKKVAKKATKKVAKKVAKKTTKKVVKKVGKK